MRIDIWADVVCPWCYIGKRRFEQALIEVFGPPKSNGASTGARPEIVYRAFELDSSIPKGVVERQPDMLMRKYGWSAETTRARQTHIEQLAAADGLTMRITEGLSGNSFDAHRLIQFAKARGQQAKMVDRLFRAHFSELRSVFDHESLVELAGEVGLDREEARAVLGSDEYAEAVKDDQAEARRLGIGGVPFYVLGGRFAVEGAQPTAVFVQGLKQAREKT